MKLLQSVSLALFLTVSFVVGAPAPDSNTRDVNPYLGKEFFLSPQYQPKVRAAIRTIRARGDRELAAKAEGVTKISTFMWVSAIADVPSLRGFFLEAAQRQLATRKKQIVQVVVYNLPDRDCSAKASAGELELAKGGEEKYKGYIQDVIRQFAAFPQLEFAVVLEPDSVGNLVTNLAVPKCGNAAPAHRRSLAYAVAHLSRVPNIHLYLDGAHAGWLGWPDNLQPTATLLGDVLAAAKAINPRARVRGLSTNVSNYNGLGNQEQQGRDELKYINDLTPLLEAVGFPTRYIVDQGRSGNQEAPREGGDWCNFSLAGFGPRPTTKTPSPLIDAVVWVKPGGEADGTSDTSAPRYDEACGSPTSLKPAPEAGTWFQEYFELLVKQANPPF